MSLRGSSGGWHGRSGGSRSGRSGDFDLPAVGVSVIVRIEGPAPEEAVNGTLLNVGGHREASRAQGLVIVLAEERAVLESDHSIGRSVGSKVFDQRVWRTLQTVEVRGVRSGIGRAHVDFGPMVRNIGIHAGRGDVILCRPSEADRFSRSISGHR